MGVWRLRGIVVAAIFYTFSVSTIAAADKYPPEIKVIPGSSAEPTSSKSFLEDQQIAPKDNDPQELPSKGMSLLEAARFTLENNRSIKIAAKQFDIASGESQSAGGDFNFALIGQLQSGREYEPLTENEKSNFQSLGIDEDAFEYDVSSVSAELRKRTRYGPVISQRLQIRYADERITDVDSTNKGEIVFNVDIPLLKGRGRVSAAANEQSAEHLFQAASLQVVHQSALSVKETADLFWAYIAAAKKLEIAEESVDRADQLLKETELLVEAGQQPRASLSKFRANLEDKIATKQSRVFSVSSAKNSLGLSLGLTAFQIKAMPVPVSAFPDISDDEIANTLADARTLSRRALSWRQDYKAILKQVAAANILFMASRRDRLPQLDLFFAMGYKGLHEGGDESDFLRGLGDNRTDPEWKTGLLFTKYFGNDSARGLLKQRLGHRQVVRMQANQLAEQIQSEVDLAMAALYSYKAELTASENSVNHYLKALDDERERFRLGLSTSIDLIDVQDRLSIANDRMIGARSQLARAAVNLRFTVGRLVEPAADGFIISKETLASLTFSELSPAPAVCEDKTANANGE